MFTLTGNGLNNNDDDDKNVRAIEYDFMTLKIPGPAPRKPGSSNSWPEEGARRNGSQERQDLGQEDGPRASLSRRAQEDTSG